MTKTEAELLVSLESLLRECAQRFCNASMSKLSEKTASEMARKCGNSLRKVENINNAIAADRIEQLEKALQWYIDNDDAEENGGFYDQGRKRAEEALR